LAVVFVLTVGANNGKVYGKLVHGQWPQPLRTVIHEEHEEKLREEIAEVRMIKLYDLSTNALIGEVTEAQFQFLLDNLEEESTDDQDYYLNQATLDMLEGAGGDPDLMAILRQGMGNKEEMDIRWVRE